MIFFYFIEYSTVQENYCINAYIFYTKIITIKQSEHKHAQVIFVLTICSTQLCKRIVHLSLQQGSACPFCLN